jgi:protocatechuate 3,4-dioxygenase beta subunit
MAAQPWLRPPLLLIVTLLACAGCTEPRKALTQGAINEHAKPAVFSGTIVSADGRELSDARVDVRQFGPGGTGSLTSRYLTTTSDSHGRFRLELDPAEYLIEVKQAGFCSASEYLIVGAGNELHRALLLVPTAQISGVVFDSNEKPASGARVALRTVDAHGPFMDAPLSTETDADGGYHFDAVRPGSVMLSAAATGSVSTTDIMVNVAPGQHLSGITIPSIVAQKVTGRVVSAEAGEPVSGVWVTAVNEATTEQFLSSHTTDRRGEFAITAVPRGGYTFWTEAAGLSHKSDTRFRVEDSDKSDLLLRAPRTFTISGKIDPALEATLTLSRRAESPDLPAMTVATRYLAKGTPDFAFDGVPGGASLITVVSREGHTARSELLVGSQETSRLTLPLASASRIAGQVVDAEGRPISGLVVMATEDPHEACTQSPTACFFGRTMTSVDGFFSLPGVSARRVALEVHDNFGRLPWSIPPDPENPDSSHYWEVAPDNHPSGPKLAVHSCRKTIRGRVKDADGRPVSNASVQARVGHQRASTAGSAGALATALSDDEGHFELSGLCSRSYAVSSVNAARTASSRTVHVRDGGDSLTLLLSPRQRLSFGVTLEGKPVTEYGVELAGDASQQFAVRSADGTFLSPYLDQGASQAVVVAQEGYVNAQLFVDETARKDRQQLELQPWSSVSGRVLDHAGRPAEGLWVIVRIEPMGRVGPMPVLAMHHRSARVKTDEGGHFTMQRLMSGRVELSVATQEGLLTIRRAIVETSAEPLRGPNVWTSARLEPSHVLDLGDLIVYRGGG